MHSDTPRYERPAYRSSRDDMSDAASVEFRRLRVSYVLARISCCMMRCRVAAFRRLEFCITYTRVADGTTKKTIP